MDPSSANSAPRVRVLIVDDSPANLIALRAVLSTLAVDIVEARSGPEALEKAVGDSFAVVLLDVQMPEMDGFEVASRIRATDAGRDVPIIFLTAIHRDEKYARKGYASGAADYITKPYDADILRARVKAFTDLYRQRDELRRRDVEIRTHERDEATRRLVAFERIASAALEEGELTALLRTLLGVFLEAADSADSATILLREDNVLRVRASVGRTTERLGRVVPIGTGLAGVIAATAEPLYASDTWAPGSLQGQELHEGGVRGLFGVPLMHDGEVIGVTQIGSTRSGDFSDVERRLLRAMAERAAWAVAQRFRFDRFRSVLMAAPAIVSIVRGPNFVCDFSNLAHRDLFAGREVIGRPASELGATPEIIAMFEQVRSTGVATVASEFPILVDFHGDGKLAQRFFNFSVQPLRAQAGEIEEILWFAIDVTTQVMAREAAERASRERAKLLESERTARAEAEIANRAKDDFLATVSHELRTPLNAILGWTVVARRQGPPELDRALGIIERNARAQTRIIEDVLDISHIVGGKLRLDITAVDVRAAVQGALETVRPQAEAKRIQLSADVGVLGVISADADRLQQVVWNILSNAIKFTPAGGSVDLIAARLEDRIVIRVADTGEGIEASFLPFLFEPFRQADGSTTRRHGGLGLGLAIVKQLVVAHGGTVRGESPGAHQGAAFTVELPAHPLPAIVGAQAPRDAASNSESDSRGVDERLTDLRVLVVDDDDKTRTALQSILAKCGAFVTCAASAAEAFEIVARVQPDVLISSVAMKKDDGYALLEQVRRLPPEEGGATPAIALTCQDDESDRAAAAGFEMHVTKPVEPVSLVDAVAHVAERKPPSPRNGVAYS